MKSKIFENPFAYPDGTPMEIGDEVGIPKIDRWDYVIKGFEVNLEDKVYPRKVHFSNRGFEVPSEVIQKKYRGKI